MGGWRGGGGKIDKKIEVFFYIKCIFLKFFFLADESRNVVCCIYQSCEQ